MSVLLDFVYLIVALLASPWLVYRLIARGDWRGLAARFGAGVGTRMAGCIWLHGSSAGEIALLVPLVRLIEESAIGSPLVISAYSATGIAAARRSFPGRRVIVFPFDLSFVVRRVLERLDPRLIVIVESEFWPNFLRVASRRRVPVAVINGKMSDKSFRFYSRSRFVPRLLSELSIVAVQSSIHEARLCALGLPQSRVRVTGNMKYDLARVPEDAGDAQLMRERLGYRVADVVIIGGSVHEREDEALIGTYARLLPRHPHARLVVVPRYPQDAGRVERLVRAAGFTVVRKTEMDRDPRSVPVETGVLIVDTVGELRDLYGIADIAYVGGSLFYRGSNKGGHNLMEPAVHGLPVVFGPYHSSFQDTAQKLIAAEAGFEVNDAQGLFEILESLLDDAELRLASGRRAERVIVAQQGATRRNFELLMPLIRTTETRLPASALSPTMPPALSDVD